MKLLLVITLFATLLRLFFFFDFHSCCGSDEGVYHNIAQNLAFRNAFVFDEQRLEPWREEIYSAKPPLYPFFIAGIYKLIDSPGYKIVELIQILLSAITGFLIYLIGKELASRKAGIIALILYSFFLETAYMSILLMSENIYWLLLSLYIYLLIRMKRSGSNLGILIGIASGLLILVRPPSIVFILLVAAWYLWKNVTRQAILNTVALVVFSFLTVLPWTIRNYNLYGQFVFIYTDGGINVWMGNHEGASGGYQVIKPDDSDKIPKLKTQGVAQEIERDKFYYDKAKEFVSKNPLQAVDLAATKVFNTFSLDRRLAVVWMLNTNKPNPLRPPLKSFETFLGVGANWQFVAIILLTGFSLLYIWQKKLFKAPFILILILILAHLVSIATTHTEFRYIMQFYPLIFPLAAVGIYILKEPFTSVRRRSFI